MACVLGFLSLLRPAGTPGPSLQTHWFVSEGHVLSVRVGGAPAGPESCGIIELLLTCPCDSGPQT